MDTVFSDHVGRATSDGQGGEGLVGCDREVGVMAAHYVGEAFGGLEDCWIWVQAFSRDMGQLHPTLCG